MRLSIVLAISMLPLSCREKLVLVKSTPSFSDLEKRYHLLGLRKRVDEFLAFLSKTEMHIIFFGMKGYPSRLALEDNPPFRLCYRGRLPEENECLVSLCGTRYPDTLGAEASYSFALEAGLNDIHIVTSHSRGIDRSALYGTRQAGTCAYVCCDCGLGTRRITENRGLAGCNLISPFEPNQEASRWRCLGRNYLTVALSSCLVVVQAPCKSGALLCASLALDMGREVFVHEQGLRNLPVNEGTRRLEDEGCPLVSGYPAFASSQGLPRNLSLQVCSEKEALYRYGNTCYSLSHGTE
ncbi:DNA-processing protein DprA [uncultured Sphaerochaeta sp.]|uniref:DNA-processing protein DprA n=1 Tax=uncultured Sphaerochaeta sp. TaxID=886478 RepID=UPI002A0A3167|nr:DNA-processing protein DprA [uncultured Sphaerochaeta sp.]